MLKFFYICAVTLLFCGPAQAVSLGDQVSCVSSYPSCSASTSNIDGTKTEFTLDNVISIDFSPDALSIENISGGIVNFASCCYLQLQDVTNKITNYNLMSSKGISDRFGSPVSNHISLNDGSLGINFNDLRFTSDAKLSFSLQSAATAAPVPEPGTWLMMLLGFGIVGAALRVSGSSAGRFVRSARAVGGA